MDSYINEIRAAVAQSRMVVTPFDVGHPPCLACHKTCSSQTVFVNSGHYWSTCSGCMDDTVGQQPLRWWHCMPRGSKWTPMPAAMALLIVEVSRG